MTFITHAQHKAAPSPAAYAFKAKSLAEKVPTLILDKIKLDKVPLESCITYLHAKSKLADPDKVGVSLLLQLHGKKKSRSKIKKKKVSLEMTNVPLESAVKYICMQTRLYYMVDSKAILISNKEFTNRILKFYPVAASFRATINPSTGKSLPTEEDLKKYFISMGVKFPKSATINFNARINRLTMNNTPANHRKMVRILKQMGVNR